MKAPENVYVRLENIGNSWDVSTLDNGGEEYIRKDIVDEMLKTAENHAYFAGQEKFREKLIEWLEGKMTVEGATEGVVGGYDLALKDVINKINSIM